MAHPLHLAIGNLVSSVIGSNLKVVLDPACGGKQNIPLFVAQEKSNQPVLMGDDVLFVQVLILRS